MMYDIQFTNSTEPEEIQKIIEEWGKKTEIEDLIRI